MPYSCFFFFQAEDGIRDSSVTGVQTCALPISAVCLYGTATIDEDLSRRRSAWVPGLARFVPGGPEDPEFVLVSLDPDRVEVWSEHDRVHPDPFGMASAVLLRSARGWAGPTTTHPGT